MLHLMLLMGSIPINHLGNYAKPLKCLNDQGGKQKAGEQKQSDPNNLETTTNKVIFPITFTNNHVFHTFGIIASDTSIFWGNSGASVITRRISRTDMRYEVHSSYQTMLKADSIIEWCVVGI